MRLLVRAFVTASGVATMTAAACSTAQHSNGEIASDTVATHAALLRLEADARALARQGGCSNASACRTAPVGARACGGPRTYVVYCAATTDSAALFAKLNDLKAAETKLNQASGSMSSCDVRMPPSVALQGGSCREATP